MAPPYMPNEILTAIASKLAVEIDGKKLHKRYYKDVNDLKLATLTALCKSSRDCREAAIPILYGTLDLNLRNKGRRRPLLNTLTQNTQLARHVRTLLVEG